MVIISDGLEALSKENLQPSSTTPTNCSGVIDRPEMSKILQETSEGVAHLSTQWPNYANSYDTNVLEIFKLIQVKHWNTILNANPLVVNIIVLQ